MAKPKIEKNIEIPDHILKHILTPSEVRMLKNRWQIINLLENGLSIRYIAKEVKVGTDTVIRVSRVLEKSGLRKLLDMKGNNAKKIKSNTPWIFGKNN